MKMKILKFQLLRQQNFNEKIRIVTTQHHLNSHFDDVKEVIKLASPSNGEVILDCTFGEEVTQMHF